MNPLAEYSDDRMAEISSAYERPSTCFLGKVFYLSRSRNAYWGRESVGRFSDFCLTFGEAKRSWVPQRGSRWRITELPAVVLASKQAAIYIVPKGWLSHELNPLLRMRRANGHMRQLCGQLNRLAGRGAFLFVSTRELAQPATLPFSVNKPESSGGSTLWMSEEHDCELALTLRLVSKFTLLLQRH